MRITDKNFPINFKEFDLLEFLKSHDFDFASKSFEQLFSLEMFFENHMTTVLQALQDNNDFDEYVLNVISFEKRLTTREIKEFYEIKPKIESESWEKPYHPLPESSNSSSKENLKGNENISWDAETIERNVDTINFVLLSSNPHVNWDFELIKKFENSIVWNVIDNDYYKQWANKRYSNKGLWYNKGVYWTKEIVHRWKEKIDIFELTLNCQIDTSVLWEYRIELLEPKLHESFLRGPKDDKEWVHNHVCGWDNIVGRRSVNFTLDLLNFLWEKGKLKLGSVDNDFSTLGWVDILKNQYSWLPELIGRNDFWQTCLKPLMFSDRERVGEFVKNKIESDFFYKIPAGSLVFDVVNKEELECYKVVSDHESCFLGQRIVVDQDSKFIIDDHIARIAKPNKFNSDHKIYILDNSKSSAVLDGKPAYYYYSLDEELHGEQSIFVIACIQCKFNQSGRLSDILGA